MFRFILNAFTFFKHLLREKNNESMRKSFTFFRFNFKFIGLDSITRLCAIKISLSSRIIEAFNLTQTAKTYNSRSDLMSTYVFISLFQLLEIEKKFK